MNEKPGPSYADTLNDPVLAMNRRNELNAEAAGTPIPGDEANPAPIDIDSVGTVDLPVTPDDFNAVKGARGLVEGIVEDEKGYKMSEGGRRVSGDTVDALQDVAEQPTYSETLKNPNLARARRGKLSSDNEATFAEEDGTDSEEPEGPLLSYTERKKIESHLERIDDGDLPTGAELKRDWLDTAEGHAAKQKDLIGSTKDELRSQLDRHEARRAELVARNTGRVELRDARAEAEGRMKEFRARQDMFQAEMRKARLQNSPRYVELNKEEVEAKAHAAVEAKFGPADTESGAAVDGSVAVAELSNSEKLGELSRLTSEYQEAVLHGDDEEKINDLDRQIQELKQSLTGDEAAAVSNAARGILDSADKSRLPAEAESVDLEKLSPEEKLNALVKESAGEARMYNRRKKITAQTAKQLLRLRKGAAPDSAIGSLGDLIVHLHKPITDEERPSPRTREDFERLKSENLVNLSSDEVKAYFGLAEELEKENLNDDQVNAYVKAYLDQELNQEVARSRFAHRDEKEATTKALQALEKLGKDWDAAKLDYQKKRLKDYVEGKAEGTDANADAAAPTRRSDIAPRPNQKNSIFNGTRRRSPEQQRNQEKGGWRRRLALGAAATGLVLFGGLIGNRLADDNEGSELPDEIQEQVEEDFETLSKAGVSEELIEEAFERPGDFQNYLRWAEAFRQQNPDMPQEQMDELWDQWHSQS